MAQEATAELGRRVVARGPSRTILLTGANGVLGRAMTRALLAAGHRLVLSDLDQAPLEAFLERSGAVPGQAIAVGGDLTDAAVRESLVARAESELSGIDMLVNNAALTSFAAWPVDSERPAPWEMDADFIRHFFEINVIAPHALISRVLPGMIARGWGRIVNITCSYDTMQRIFPYGTTKAALEAGTATLQAQLVGTGVTANTLNPGGPVATPEHVAKNPGRKWVGPDVMNAPLLWLASAASDSTEGRRYVGAPWPEGMPPNEALARASGPMAWRGFGDEAMRLAPGQEPPKPTERKRKTMQLSLEDARIIITAASAEAARLNRQMAIAIVDAGGYLITADRGTGARPLTPAIAQSKAYSAAVMQRPTSKLKGFAESEPSLFAQLSQLGLQPIVAALGGLPIIMDGQVVGAIGTSGGSGQEDEAVAVAGLKAAGLPVEF